MPGCPPNPGIDRFTDQVRNGVFKAEYRRLLEGTIMRRHQVMDVIPPEQEFVELQVVIIECFGLAPIHCVKINPKY